MKTKVELITPQIAMAILENHNPKNRTVSEATVQAYANDMKNGRWVLNHQGIAFDADGNLIDGQHRLWAIVFSEKSIELLVTRDVPAVETKGGVELFAMDTVDRGRVRATGQQMQLAHNIKNGNQVAAACRSICGLISPSQSASRLSTSNSLMVYDVYGKDIDTVIGCLETRKRLGYITGPLSMFHHGEPEQAREFCQQMCSMENMADAVRTFVKYVEQYHRKGTDGATTRVLCNALLAFHKGAPIKRLKDSTIGRDYITGMFPSLNKRIRDAIKPISGKSIKLKKKDKE